jgi:DNA-binding transcriptional ArsR family regulator
MVNYSTSLDATFSALSDPTRRTILTTLQRGRASVTELARPHDISMPAILKHLRVLEQAGFIEQKKPAVSACAASPSRPCSRRPTGSPSIASSEN